MSYVSRIGALLSGIAVCIVPAYISFFFPDPSRVLGDYYKFTALEGLVRALPVFVVSLVWFWATLRWLARPARAGVWWCLAGLIVGFIYFQFVGALQNYEWCSVFVRVSRSWYECKLRFLSNRPFDFDLAAGLLVFLSGLAAAAATVLRSDRIHAHDGSTKKELLPLHSALGTWALSAIVVASLSASYTTWSDFRDYARDLDSEREQDIRSLNMNIGATVHALQHYILPAAHKPEEFWGRVHKTAIGLPSGYGPGLLSYLRGLRGLEPESRRPPIDRAITGTVKLSDLAAVRAASGDGDVSDSDRELVNGILRTYFDDPRWKKGWN